MTIFLRAFLKTPPLLPITNATISPKWVSSEIGRVVLLCEVLVLSCLSLQSIPLTPPLKLPLLLVHSVAHILGVFFKVLILRFALLVK